MLNDRNYYAQCDDATLIALAKEGDSELALVLAERLAGALLDIEVGDSEEIADMKCEIEDLKDELLEARSTIRYLETELENVK